MNFTNRQKPMGGDNKRSKVVQPEFATPSLDLELQYLNHLKTISHYLRSLLEFQKKIVPPLAVKMSTERS